MDINKLELTDKSIKCLECLQDFIFTVNEQRFYGSKGLSRPKRCAECRKIRKGTIVKDEHSSGHY